MLGGLGFDRCSLRAHWTGIAESQVDIQVGLPTRGQRRLWVGFNLTSIEKRRNVGVRNRYTVGRPAARHVEIITQWGARAVVHFERRFSNV